MKKIIKISLVITLFLSSIYLIPNINAAAPHGLDFAVKKGELIYWTANFVDETALETLYGVDWEDDIFFSGLEDGAKMRLNLTNIDPTYMHTGLYPGILYGIDVWDWTVTDTWVTKQISGNYYYLKDFDDYTTYIYHTTAVPLIMLAPAEEFLEGYSDILSPNYYTVALDNIIFGHFQSGEVYALDDVFYFAKYNSRGILSHLNIFNELHELVVDITLDSSGDSTDDSIPGFDLIIVLGTSSLLLIGIIVYIIKRIKV